ncbi:MAG TPA: LuxR C-terminal-related transcriptional regulator, partial [Acidimicrobiales bacterium]|nr:LuxR C-terminal-related transcriptional regulator [Acidimicrobiales bacterium]
IPPLAVPAAETTPMPIGALSQFESVRLFLDRARHVRPNFHLGDDHAPAVAGICQRLDGIPLAIELAAARCRSLSPSQILDGLADAFRLLTGGGRAVLARQQTLEASIGWSHALLSTKEQVLLRRLSVFRGGCTLDDAEAVVADDQFARGEVLDLLDRLVAQSLVQVTDDNLSAPRYTMLETVRQYGARQLEAADETERFRTCHADHFVAVANEVGPRMEGTDERQAFARLVADHDNIRAAFDELASSARWDDYAVLVWSCYWLWQVLNPVEGVSRLTRLFEMGTISRRSDEGRARLAGGYLEYYSGNVVAAFTNVSEALSIGEEIGDETVAGRAAAWLAFMAGFVDPIVALPDLEAAAARLHKASDACGEVWARIMMMTLYFLIRHDQREGRRRYADVVQLIERSGGLYARYHLYGVAARGAALQGDLTLTEAEARKSETAIRALATAAGLDGDLFARMNGNIDDARTHVALLSGEPRTVLDRLPQLIAENQADSLMLNVLSLAPFLALDRIACGDALGATDVLDQLLQLTRPLGLSGLALPYAADAARALGDEAAANALLDELESDSHFESHLYFVCMGRISRSALTLAAGELGSAEDSAHKALVLAHEQLFRHELIQCLELLATIAAANQAWSETARLHGASLRIRQETGITMRLPLYADPYDAAVKAAESALGTEAFAAARAEGHGLGLDDAVAYAQRARGERGRPSFGWDSLTPTEHQVVDLVIEGLTNPQIAERLLVSPDTVKTHLAHVFAKLGVKRRAELAAVAARRI